MKIRSLNDVLEHQLNRKRKLEFRLKFLQMSPHSSIDDVQEAKLHLKILNDYIADTMIEIKTEEARLNAQKVSMFLAKVRYMENE